ncbi:hypothetical protein ACFSHT_10250 [Paraburkholderia silviterrae]|nr:hypothetical protein [Paraburkholderia silviterrae]
METIKLGARLAVAILAVFGLLLIQAQMQEREAAFETRCNVHRCT